MTQPLPTMGFTALDLARSHSVDYESGQTSTVCWRFFGGLRDANWLPYGTSRLWAWINPRAAAQHDWAAGLGRVALVKRRNDELLSIDYSHSRNRPGVVNNDSGALGGPREVGGGAVSGTGCVNLG